MCGRALTAEADHRVEALLDLFGLRRDEARMSEAQVSIVDPFVRRSAAWRWRRTDIGRVALS